MQLLLIFWALPWTSLGVFFGVVALVTGGKAQRVGRVLEFHGGWLPWVLNYVPIVGGAAAMTLGHVVIARSKKVLDHCRDHELVHVRQYERWGPLFVPAYLACSVWLMLNRQDPYLENPFEKEAYDESP
jgi:hypothetical protein